MRKGLAAASAVLGLVVCGAIAVVAPHRGASVSAAELAAAPPAVPVTTGIVTTRSLPVFLHGIGTVQAFNTDTIRSQVDGKIVGVDFKEGQEVKAGALLFQIDPRPYEAALAQAEAAQAKDKAQLVSAQADFARTSRLVTSGFQTRQTYDQQKAQVAQLNAAIAGDQAAIEIAKLNLGYTNIRAPIGGRLGAQLVDIGNLVRASNGAALVTLNQIRPILVSFALPQQDLDPIRAAQAKAPLTVETFSADGKHELAGGKLVFIDNAIQGATGTIQLKAQFANTNERLWPGEFVNARLTLGDREDVPTVPESAVQQGASGYFVYVVRPDDTVERRGVEVAVIQDGVAAIEKGLKAGERVVVQGQYRLTDGARIAPRPAGHAVATD